MKMDWLALAFLGMVFASLANISLKVVVKQGLPQFGFQTLALAGAAIVFLAAALAFLGLENKWFSRDFVQWGIALAFFAALSFACTVLALRQGKVALITAVLSLSTAVVAVLSYAFLGDRFTVKEAAALGLAVLSILALVL